MHAEPGSSSVEQGTKDPVGEDKGRLSSDPSGG